MLTINPISIKNVNRNIITPKKQNVSAESENIQNSTSTSTLPTTATYLKTHNLSFKARIVGDIEHKEYMEMSEDKKAELRDLYNNFYKKINIQELHRPMGRTIYSKLPLTFEADMDDFLRVSKSYNEYKDHKIICVGRSPKWFLNAAIWMKDGIQPYDFVAFSSNWYKRNNDGLGLRQTFVPERYPNPEEKAAYKQYLKKQNCTPSDIIKSYKETGKQVIITDYIHSGCGVTSFLELLAQYADEKGQLEDFAKSIKLFTLSSMEYIEELGRENSYMYPTVILTDILKPFNIVQEYHDMSPSVMREVLIDKNTNECRSTYFPPAAWTVYDPNKYRTGIIPDEVLKSMPKIKKRIASIYTDAMKDYRNLLNFRILDALNERGLLKPHHITR